MHNTIAFFFFMNVINFGENLEMSTDLLELNLLHHCRHLHVAEMNKLKH